MAKELEVTRENTSSPPPLRIRRGELACEKAVHAFIQYWGRVRQVWTRVMQGWGLVALATVTALAGACTTDQPLPTLMVIYVTATPEPSNTPEPTVEVTPTPVVAALPTLVPATATPTPLPATIPPTLTPSFTPTFTETPGPTFNPAPVSGTSMPNSGACVGGPGGGFATIYNSDAALAANLGCAVGAPIAITSAVQEFESGRMVWASQLGEIPQRAIYAVYSTGTYQRFDDNWIEGVDPVIAPGSDGAPSGRTAPIRGFGKVWAANPAVKGGLRWALSSEAGAPGQMGRGDSIRGRTREHVPDKGRIRRNTCDKLR
jgi:hypothetical protein